MDSSQVHNHNQTDGDCGCEHICMTSKRTHKAEVRMTLRYLLLSKLYGFPIKSGMTLGCGNDVEGAGSTLNSKNEPIFMMCDNNLTFKRTHFEPIRTHPLGGLHNLIQRLVRRRTNPTRTAAHKNIYWILDQVGNDVRMRG